MLMVYRWWFTYGVKCTSYCTSTEYGRRVYLLDKMLTLFF